MPKVGMKAANVGSLLRQAPWLVVERIDGQMLPVVRFLRRVGVFDMERIVRAYPKILCLNVRSDLVPRVRDIALASMFRQEIRLLALSLFSLSPWFRRIGKWLLV